MLHTLALIKAWEDHDKELISSTAIEEQKQWAGIKISMVWLYEDGSLIEDEEFIALLEEKYLSFTGGYTLGYNIVEGGSIVYFKENIISWSYVYEYTGYYFIFEGLALNGEYSDNNLVCFTAEAGEIYKVIFYCKLVVKNDPPPGVIVDTNKIPSNAHFDRWWKYGVLCCAAPTASGSNHYTVAFRPGFWNIYNRVTIAFGNGGSIDFSQSFTVDSPNYEPFAIPVHCKPHYTDGAGFLGQSLPAYHFDDPHGLGSRQAWRIELVLK